MVSTKDPSESTMHLEDDPNYQARTATQSCLTSTGSGISNSAKGSGNGRGLIIITISSSGGSSSNSTAIMTSDPAQGLRFRTSVDCVLNSLRMGSLAPATHAVFLGQPARSRAAPLNQQNRVADNSGSGFCIHMDRLDDVQVLTSFPLNLGMGASN